MMEFRGKPSSFRTTSCVASGGLRSGVFCILSVLDGDSIWRFRSRYALCGAAAGIGVEGSGSEAAVLK
jgi:hypothetical protein